MISPLAFYFFTKRIENIFKNMLNIDIFITLQQVNP